jgi:hypothetical protein
VALVTEFQLTVILLDDAALAVTPDGVLGVTACSDFRLNFPANASTAPSFSGLLLLAPLSPHVAHNSAVTAANAFVSKIDFFIYMFLYKFILATLNELDYCSMARWMS